MASLYTCSVDIRLVLMLIAPKRLLPSLLPTPTHQLLFLCHLVPNTFRYKRRAMRDIGTDQEFTALVQAGVDVGIGCLLLERYPKRERKERTGVYGYKRP